MPVPSGVFHSNQINANINRFNFRPNLGDAENPASQKTAKYHFGLVLCIIKLFAMHQQECLSNDRGLKRCT